VHIIALIILYTTAFFVIFVLVPTILMNLLWLMPFVPTPMMMVREALDLAKLKGRETIYDLGAGDGRTVVEATRRHPKINAIGYEVATGPWLLAQLRKRWYRSSAKIYLRNFMNVDLSDADVIFVYLSPRFMRMLLPKFKAELKPGTKIISHAFVFPDRKPDEIKQSKAKGWVSQKLYLYIW
jgi:cyclopropane fatty-acyl-phospholipid synthase-like methyltransferase